MSGISTSTVGAAHAYTREDSPWQIDCLSSSDRLVRYLSGGGLSTFGRSVRQEMARRRQNRFLGVAAAIGVAWIVLLIV